MRAADGIVNAIVDVIIMLSTWATKQIQSLVFQFKFENQNHNFLKLRFLPMSEHRHPETCHDCGAQPGPLPFDTAHVVMSHYKQQ